MLFSPSPQRLILFTVLFAIAVYILRDAYLTKRIHNRYGLPTVRRNKEPLKYWANMLFMFGAALFFAWVLLEQIFFLVTAAPTPSLY
jgi:hypothetical protein